MKIKFKLLVWLKADKRIILLSNSLSVITTVNEDNNLKVPLINHDDENNSNELEKNIYTINLYITELKTLIQYAVPIIVSEILRNTLILMPVVFIGHKTSFELASVSLGLLIGLDTTIDKLCSQVYTEAKTTEEKKLVGKILQRGFVTLVTFCGLICLLWEYTEPNLIFCNQDPKIAKVSGIFPEYERHGLIPYILFECEKRILQIQGGYGHTH
ncbi:hypothetical protein BCR32DRAFT_279489 [Anaeromyces robustus]|uniref:Uncharacterized protein n=1 Tax=Anaeromyces robustus TaxID=1754192 RepID=A0A1Y1X7K9_9FUNG|nr:hypothetical protein BCR32DRAFT_279489 [Anaeromyces robustus]|eukprot:ORX81732.1 hypothetical protein BCR32DRAFT_279489 [Anaeromyces robustus]